jgi:serine O-acetyltransferase
MAVQQRSQGVARRLVDAFFAVRTRWYSPLAHLALASPRREVILEDVGVWARNMPSYVAACDAHDHVGLIAALASREPAFRNLLYYRLEHDAGSSAQIVVGILKRIWKPEPTLRLYPESLGPRCFILHGWETSLLAGPVGSDLWLGPHVGTGFTGPGKCPVIGDRVTLAVGSIILGDITIGDGATVGAGAVVLKDVAPGETVVGVPARPIHSGKKEKQPSPVHAD